MALVSDALTYARQKGQTDSNGISDTNGIAWANVGLTDATREYIKHGVDASQIQESYTTISSSDTTPGQFAWPSDMWALKTIEVDFTGAGGQNYIQARRLDVSNLQGKTSFDFVRANQPTNEPLFENYGNTAEVFPMVTGTALVRIFYYLVPTSYTATSDTISYPFSLDYRIIGDAILIGYYQSLEKFDSAQYWQTQMLAKVQDSVHILSPQSKQPIEPEVLHITGWDL